MQILTPKQIFDSLSTAAQDQRLTGADLKLLIFVCVTRRDGTTGEAYVKDLFITEQTGLSRAAIKRSRNKLIAFGYIKTKPGSVNHHATIYTPILQQGSPLSPALPSLEGEQRKWGSAMSPVRLTNEPSGGSALSPVRPQQGSALSPARPRAGRLPPPPHDATISNNPTAAIARSLSRGNNYYAEFDSPQWNYWDAFLRKTTGKGACRDRRGGWYFPTEWPSEIEALVFNQRQDS